MAKKRSRDKTVRPLRGSPQRPAGPLVRASMPTLARDGSVAPVPMVGQGNAIPPRTVAARVRRRSASILKKG